MKAACFGDTFSHTYAAAREILRAENAAKCDIVCFDTVYDTLLAVADEKCHMAVVPIENSVEGTVSATCDAIYSLSLYVVREIVLPIKQNLIALEGVKLADIKRVYSHPQALAQCRKHIAEVLPNAKTEAVAFTSAGLEKLDGESAAIARSPKAGQYIAAEGFEDSSDNSTRFLAVKSEPRMAGGKVSIAFSTDDNPGALLTVLEILKAHSLNMTKIESRPAKKKLGQYVFYTDFVTSGDNAALREVFAEIEDCAKDLRFLGRYPQFGKEA